MTVSERWVFWTLATREGRGDVEGRRLEAGAGVGGSQRRVSEGGGEATEVVANACRVTA